MVTEWPDSEADDKSLFSNGGDYDVEAIDQSCCFATVITYTSFLYVYISQCVVVFVDNDIFSKECRSTFYSE